MMEFYVRGKDTRTEHRWAVYLQRTWHDDTGKGGHWRVAVDRQYGDVGEPHAWYTDHDAARRGLFHCVRRLVYDQTWPPAHGEKPDHAN